MGRWNPLRRGSVVEPVRSRSRKPRGDQKALRHRGLRIEQCESRMLLSILDLAAVIGSDGTKYLPADRPVLTVAPKQMTFELSLDQTVDAKTLSGIQITRAGPDKLFNTNDDVVIQPGWSGIGDQPNEVVVRFAQDLPSDLYRVTFVGQGSKGANVYLVRTTNLLRRWRTPRASPSVWARIRPTPRMVRIAFGTSSSKQPRRLSRWCRSRPLRSTGR